MRGACAPSSRVRALTKTAWAVATSCRAVPTDLKKVHTSSSDLTFKQVQRARTGKINTTLMGPDWFAKRVSVARTYRFIWPAAHSALEVLGHKLAKVAHHQTTVRSCSQIAAIQRLGTVQHYSALEHRGRIELLHLWGVAANPVDVRAWS